ncbi:hypothetical protein LO771_07000 [Streptacidiphilus sp. ASG 303]|uniref:hypothetical protein n=1 Tax=Streptacidiphilus sp. ASG 303 TaxID=2896847 RepID=UPI001E4AB142|nr:hypothetical protein [Streptacidiphilus sp. ASG 303]MCD0482170.1 hypothetical protein [Streptacidiphilus sp. ASG 303]
MPAGSAAPDGAAPAAATSALPGPGGLPGADGPPVPVAGADDAAPPFSAVAAGTYLPLGMGLGMVGAGVALVGLRLRRG